MLASAVQEIIMEKEEVLGQGLKEEVLGSGLTGQA